MVEPVSSIQPPQPTLILLHGATGNGRMWDPVRRELDPRYRVLTPDLPGHGARRDETYSVAEAAATVAATARSVWPAPVVVGGDSLGGYSTIAAAAALPADQLKGLIVAGATFNFIGPEVLPLVLRGWLMRVLIAIYGEPSLVEKSVAKGFGDGPGKMKLAPEDLRALLDGGLSIRAWPQCVEALRGIDFKAKVAAIEQPILFVNGDRDKPNMRHEAEFLAVARDARSENFRDCEHGVSLWRVREFSALVNVFAAECFGAGR